MCAVINQVRPACCRSAQVSVVNLAELTAASVQSPTPTADDQCRSQGTKLN